MPEISVGDKVRVSYEGEVLLARPWTVGDVHIGTRYRVKRPDGITSTFGVRERGSSYNVEVVEPVYEDDGIYRDKDGDIFRYDASDNTWLMFGCPGSFTFDYATRPLVRIDTP